MKPCYPILILMLVARTVLTATYDVPVPTELARHGQWMLKDAHAILEGSTLSVIYRLPLDLVGKDAPEFKFRGRTGSSFIQVSGDGVYGVCMSSADKPLACMLKYPYLSIDEPSRDEALKAKFAGDELLQRERVVRLFSNDPAGILSIDALVQGLDRVGLLPEAWLDEQRILPW